MSFEMKAILLGGLMALPSAVWAECPVAADVAHGVFLRTADGSTELHRETAPGRLAVRIKFADGEGSIMDYAHGLYAIGSVPVSQGVPQPGDTMVFTEARQAMAWPAPKPNAKWVNKGKGGAKARSGQAATVGIGACSYRGFDVTLEFTDEPGYSETYTYLPDLGIAMLIETRDASGADRFTYVGIEKAE